jgi:hypothetical protein
LKLLKLDTKQSLIAHLLSCIATSRQHADTLEWVANTWPEHAGHCGELIAFEKHYLTAKKKELMEAYALPN